LARREADEARGHSLAHCPACGITKTVFNDELKTKLEGVGLSVGDREFAEFVMSEYGNPYDDQIFSDGQILSDKSPR